MLVFSLVVVTWLRRARIDGPGAVVAPDGDVSRSATPLAASIDTRVCAECHAEVVEAYARSGMSHTWRTAVAGITSELKGQDHVADMVSGYDYRVAVTGTGIEQIETRPDDAKHKLRRHAHYLVGSGKNAIAGVSAENGYLTQMPVAWFRHDQAWRMNPGFELHNHRFDRPITPGCIACHATAAVHEPPTANRFQEPIGVGIACQRCHGYLGAH